MIIRSWPVSMSHNRPCDFSFSAGMLRPGMVAVQMFAFAKACHGRGVNLVTLCAQQPCERLIAPAAIQRQSFDQRLIAEKVVY